MRTATMKHAQGPDALTREALKNAEHGSYFVDDDGDLWIKIGDQLHFFCEGGTISFAREVSGVAAVHRLRHALSVEIAYS